MSPAAQVMMRASEMFARAEHTDDPLAMFRGAHVHAMVEQGIPEAEASRIAALAIVSDGCGGVTIDVLGLAQRLETRAS